MKRIAKLKYLSLFFLLLFIQFLVYAQNIEKRNDSPNVILIMTDDQGYGDLSCHGNPILRTPNLDKLFNTSIRFTDFHVAPMCTPTRGEVLTGLSAFHNRATFVNQTSSIRPHVPTMADIFLANRYATGQFGKWHLGDNYPFRPQDRGFQETVHNRAWGITSMADFWNNDYFDDTYEHNGQLQQYQGYCTDVWFNEAMKWMKEQHSANKPFFAYIPTNVPHVPHIVENKYTIPYKKNLNDDVARFFGMIAEFDENLGRLERFLEENKLKENTILIFMSDNGTASGESVYNAGMRGKKTSYYEGGHRVPLFIRWPAVGLNKPRDINVLAHGTDILPTLIDLCKLNNPDSVQFDGIDLAPLVLGRETVLPDRKIVIQYREMIKTKSAVLWNKWRLVNYDELYNIATDRGQEVNLSEKHPDIVNEMRNYYDSWYAEMVPLQVPINYIKIGTEHEPETLLTSCDWIGDYADSWINTARKPNVFGYWDLQIEESGEYEISLYRWPRESNTSLNDILSIKTQNSPQKALPVSAAELRLNNYSLSKETAPGDTCAKFRINLKKDDQIRLEGIFLDESGDKLCGSYFTCIKKL
jgi:arylsulfatase A-like enzyme